MGNHCSSFPEGTRDTARVPTRVSSSSHTGGRARKEPGQGLVLPSCVCSCSGPGSGALALAGLPVARIRLGQNRTNHLPSKCERFPASTLYTGQ